MLDKVQITKALPTFSQTLKISGMGELRRAPLSELQVNLGRLCNQACEHCHVDAGPKRTEIMTRTTATRITEWAISNDIQHVDLTGGAPELNPSFRFMVERLRDVGIQVTARCNLTVLFEPKQEDLAEWYADRQVRLVCSLPCYSQENVDQQRGRGVFEKSIRALQNLTALGYGSNPDLQLFLVYNPIGASLPPDQKSLEKDYRQRLEQDFGIQFTGLFALANLPINRFAHFLERTGQLEAYQRLLVESFNPETVSSLMCRHLISVDWLGRIYDCDFNQMLDIPSQVNGATNTTPYLWEISPDDLSNAFIRVGPHCYGCTAGAGSSCGGSLT